MTKRIYKMDINQLGDEIRKDIRVTERWIVITALSIGFALGVFVCRAIGG